MLLVYTCRFTRHSLSYYLDPKPQVQSYSNLYALKYSTSVKSSQRSSSNYHYYSENKLIEV